MQKRMFIPPGGFMGFAQQTVAVQSLLSPRAKTRAKPTRARKKTRRKVAKKRPARRRTATKRTRRKTTSRRKPARLVKGSAAAKRHMAKLRKMRRG